MAGCRWFPNTVCLDCDHVFKSGAVAVCPACGHSRLAHISIRYTESGSTVEGHARVKVLRSVLSAHRGRSRPKPAKPRAPSARERWAAREAGR